LVIGDVRKSHGDGQGSGGGSASPKTMGDQSPKAQGCSLGAAGMKNLALSADLLPTR
jgi:hypothetical protein